MSPVRHGFSTRKNEPTVRVLKSDLDLHTPSPKDAPRSGSLNVRFTLSIYDALPRSSLRQCTEDLRRIALVTLILLDLCDLSLFSGGCCELYSRASGRDSNPS